MTISSNSQTNWFAGVDNLTPSWLIPYAAVGNPAVAVNIGDLMYDRGAVTGASGDKGVAYPAGQQASQGSEAADQALFARTFIGCATEGCLSTEVNATRQLVVKTEGAKFFTCPSQTFKLGDLVGVYSDGTHSPDATQVDACNQDPDRAIGVVIPVPGNPTYYASAVTQVYVYFVGRWAGQQLPLQMLKAAVTNAFTALPRNMLDGGDMTTNPAQRGTSQAADIAGTLTYGPDRWAFKGAAGSAINWSINADTSVAGFSKSLKFQRKSGNADVTALNLCQVMETLDSVRAQGQLVTFSVWMKKGANYSGGAVTVKVESGTGTDQSASNLLAGSWTGQSDVVSATQALTTTMTRYTWTGLVPTGCTQIGVQLTWTPTGTAGADDSVTVNGFQLEVGGTASAYEHRDLEVELALCQRYYFRVTEANGLNVCTGAPTGTNTQAYSFPLPTPMRAAPTVTVTAGGFKLVIDGAAPAAVTTFAAGSVHSNTFINLTTANTLSAAAHSILLQGSAATGLIEASADY